MTVFCACRNTAIVTLLLGLLVYVPGSRAESPAAPGELWQVISVTSNHRSLKQMPPEKLEVCAARKWTSPPGGDDKVRGCVSADFLMRGTKATWTFRCKGPPAITGKGEIYRDSDDAYSGTLQYPSDEGNVVVSLSGRRIGQCPNPQ